MKGEISYKSGTFLTDGKAIIYLGYASPPTWTPENNYGRKRTEYSSCKTFPKKLFIQGVKVIPRDGIVPGLWLQSGYLLKLFRPISKRLINTSIIKNLTR